MMDSTELKTISDRFDEALGDAEDFIEALGYGVEASAQLIGEREWVGFRRTREGWQLTFEFEKDGERQQCSLTEVSRARKVRAARQLEELIANIRGAASGLGRDITAATEHVRRVLEREMSV